MRMSQLFCQTTRETPSNTEVSSHKLLLRAGYIRQASSGIFSYLPLAQRSMTKIEDIIRQEVKSIGGQEICLPVIQPADLYIDKFNKLGNDIGSFEDINNHKMIISMMHEEVFADLVSKEIRSYKQLPLLLYQIQINWHDLHQPRAGLLNAREFFTENSYCLDTNLEGMENHYLSQNQAFQRIFRRCNLPVLSCDADADWLNDDLAHEFVYLTSSGEDTIVICDQCGYSVNVNFARAEKTADIGESPKPIEVVATPHSKTIDSLASFLSLPASKTAKALFMNATIRSGNEYKDQLVIAILRGDMHLNERKLKQAINALHLRPATEEEIIAVGATPGYASPVGLKEVLTIVDDIIPNSVNLVAGANIEGYHLINVNYGRDYKADIVSDISKVQEGDKCTVCGSPLYLNSGVVVGKSRKTKTKLSERMKCFYLDKQGQANPVFMGFYEIGISRLLACIAEEHHDDYGLKWPISISPYKINLISLPWKKSLSSIAEFDMCESLYERFISENIECLYDDREESPGVKFNDSDLIGIPIRLTISERSIKNGGVEYKRRNKEEKNIIPYENIIPVMKEEIKLLESEMLPI
jgi:prolyl-tRNA synthetase